MSDPRVLFIGDDLVSGASAGHRGENHEPDYFPHIYLSALNNNY